MNADGEDNRALTNRNAAVTQRSEYDPFGTIRTQSGSGSSDFGYADEQRDAETRLINLRARYYDPALGRFLSREGLKGHDGLPRSLNRYAYAYNNPARFIDPSRYDGEEAINAATAADPVPVDNPSESGAPSLPGPQNEAWEDARFHPHHG